MSPETFEEFLKKLHTVTERNVLVGHPEILLEKQGMITLWCLANMESFRSIGDRFGISKSTYRVPGLCIMEAFQAINGLEGVIGCIDGSHIKILPPQEYPNSYCNRKNFHSVLLQGVCDNRKLFTHVYAGEPGSMHDSRLFEKSDLFNDIRCGAVTFPNNSHLVGDLAYKLTEYLMVGFKDLVGDLAYKLTEYLMVGFKDNGFLTNRQKILIENYHRFE
ncbi:DDE superfamily endonuclease [Popillia japonica]|uniref:DDE superfamily endonuclease n=1 Tax=Popillia japonica TaxID=7064 RepID=A0AAW1I8G1_POPJA